MSAPAYPLFLRLAGKDVLVVGGGAVAREKGKALAASGARLSVVAPEIDPELAEIATVRRGTFSADDLDGVWMVVAAAPPEVNRIVRAAAEARRLFVLAVDDAENASAIGAARLERGGVTVAISSDGTAPALVALLRRALEVLLPDDVAVWREIASRARAEWKSAGVPMHERRPRLLSALNELYARDARLP